MIDPMNPNQAQTDNEQLDSIGSNTPHQYPIQTSPSVTTQTANPVIKEDGGLLLAKIALLISFFVGLAGVVMGFIAKNKSKKAGFKNRIAIIAIILGLAQFSIVTVFIIPPFEKVLKCVSSESSTIFIDNKVYKCNQELLDVFRKPTKEAVNISNTKVTETAGLVESTCFTFSLPEGYEMYPKSLNCNTYVRNPNRPLTQINIKAQVGDNDVDSFIEKIESTASKSNLPKPVSKKIMISGIESAVAYTKNSLGIEQGFYYIPVSKGSYRNDNRDITSILVSGPYAENTTKNAMDIIINSFKLI